MTCQDGWSNVVSMNMIKVSSKVDETAWHDLKKLASESHQQISGVLTEAISEYVQRRRIRPEVLDQLQKSMNENDELGKLLAK